MVEKWWGTHRSSNVIMNGIEVPEVLPEIDPKLLRLRRDFDKVFVCSAHWHPQKRLVDDIRLFKHIQTTMYPRSCLIVLGPNPEHVIPDPTIFYAGPQTHAACLHLYAFADWMIHLAWLDHCPNVVIEAQAMGLPVICTDAGGTVEIVGSDGIILRDLPYNYELVDYDSPPPVDVTQLTSLPERIVFDRTKVDIKRAAREYEAVFESVKK